mgnify:CR=1 FL=1
MNEVTRIQGDVAEGTCAMLSMGEDGFAGHYIDQFRKDEAAEEKMANEMLEKASF